ncbi:hypothetical protein [Streptomyces globisporus]|uniref:hypothetical protein n=1 Tax=Streptomyces globisporus TaxID=1908 RepID=UPI0004CBADCE|nr:hypothetical protein [Streptomyces globisporus]
MTMHQQADEVRAFAQYLRDLVARLDPGRGWYGVFARRDPAGMRSCLDGVEIPPWDVVESLLADLAALHSARFAEQVSVRAAALHSASAAAHDRRPGGRQELVHRLELMVREQHRAAQRLRGTGPGGPGPADSDALAWARDDHDRATARCAELRKRLAAVAAPEGRLRSEDGEVPRAGAGGAAGITGAAASESAGAGRIPQPRAEAGSAVAGRPHHRGLDAEDEPGAATPARGAPAEAFGAAGPHGATGSYAAAEPPGTAEPSTGPGAPAPTPAPRRKKPRGARFAGLDVDEEAAAYVPSPLPGPPEPEHSGAPAPRGARFGGAEAEGDGGREGHGGPVGRGRGRAGRDRGAGGPAAPLVPDPGAVRAVAGAVAQLLRLRAEGRSGEAHVVLCEVAAWPAPRLPVLALALHRAGLAADWTTLLWEVSSLPPAGLAAAAGALAAAGREADCGLLLRQGVARPAAEAADAALALDGAGREDQARDLLGAFVRVHTPREAAELALSGGTRLLPLLLAAAREVSGEAEWDLVHALRVAGVPGV